MIGRSRTRMRLSVLVRLIVALFAIAAAGPFLSRSVGTGLEASLGGWFVGGSPQLLERSLQSLGKRGRLCTPLSERKTGALRIIVEVANVSGCRFPGPKYYQPENTAEYTRKGVSEGGT